VKVSGTRTEAFDGEWLAALSEAATETHGGGRLQELYLERRLEALVRSEPGGVVAEECRTEGVAARWEYPSRSLLVARTGISMESIGHALSAPGRAALRRRPRPVPELDPPREWSAWAERVLATYGEAPLDLRLIARRAAVVRTDGWSLVETPPLVRVRRTGLRSQGLLAVWGRPEIGTWIRALTAASPARSWSPPSGTRLTVLLTEGTSGVLLHELIGHLVESDLAASGMSPLASLSGAEICPPSVSIRDDPTRMDLPGGFTCDDEGVAAQPRTLVERGVLTGWLCDRLGERLLHQPPGRGRRASWNHPPVARMSNLVMEAGSEDPATLERGLTQGLVVTRVGAATVDARSGKVLLRIEAGWEVRHGRRRRALAPCHLVGAVLPLLAQMDPAIGNDPKPEWRLGWCVKDGLAIPTGSEAPSVLVHGLEVL